MKNHLGKSEIQGARIFGNASRSLIVSLFLLVCGSLSYAQLPTVYVDALNGSDSFTGANPADTPSGTGPKATIHAGLTAVADGGRLVIFAGIYAGDGIDTDGSPANAIDNADIAITLGKYPQLTKGLTIELRSLGTANEVRIFADANSLRAPNGALIAHSADQYIPNFVFNIPGGALVITTTSGSEYLSLAARDSAGSRIAGVALVAGTCDIDRSSAFRLLNGSSITMTGSARFLREAPQKQSDMNLTYVGGGSITAGKESSYPSFGSGVLTVAKDAGTTVTFPYATTFSGGNDAIRVQSGNAIFNGALTLGTAGGSGVSRAADIIVSTNGSVAFNAPVILTVVNGAAGDSSISTIENAGSGTTSFQQIVTWNAAGSATDRSVPASETTAIIWNAGSGSLVFANGIVLSHALASGANPATVEIGIQNEGRGSLKFGDRIQVVPRASTNPVGTQQFAVAVFNAGGGTLEVSGTIGSRLVNARSGSFAGTVNIVGPTTVGLSGRASGYLLNGQDAVINLGANTLTLSGAVNHAVKGSYFTSTTGGIVIDASDTVRIDGGSLPKVTVRQQLTGTTVFPNAASFKELIVTSGNCLLQSTASVTGGVEVTGGTLYLEGKAGSALFAESFRQRGGATTLSGSANLKQLIVDSGSFLMQSSVVVTNGVEQNDGLMTVQDAAEALLTAGSFRQTGGAFFLGGGRGGVLKLLGDLVRTGGSFSAGSSSSVILAGLTEQTIDAGPTLQLGTLVLENSAGVVRCIQPVRVSTNLTIGAGARLDLGSATILLNGVSASFRNNGSFDASGLGIVLGGTSTLPGGASLSGSEIQAGPGSRFTSLTIDVGQGNVCSLKAQEDVKWSGRLSLLSGALDVASPVDFSPESVSSRLVIDVLASKNVLHSVGSFNRTGKRFTMELRGTLQGEYTLHPEFLTDLLHVDTLDIEVNSDAADTDGTLVTGQPRYFQFPSGVFVFGGSLVVGPLAAVRLQGDGKSGGSIELTGITTHRVRGILTTADAGDLIVVGGEKATLTGGVQAGDAALVGNLAVRSSSLCRIVSVRGFLGSVTTLPGSTLALSMGVANTEQGIAGSLILNGIQFILEGNVEVKNGVVFGSGKIDFGMNDLKVSTSGDFIQSPSAAGYETRGGSLVMARPRAHLRIGSTEQLGLPNLRVLADTYLDTLCRVTRALTIGAEGSDGIPTLFLGRTGNDLIFTGSSISLLSNGSGNHQAIVADGTSDGTPGGRFFVVGTSVTLVMNGDFGIEEMVYNPPAIDGTISILSTDLTPRVLTISDILTHAGGQIALGFNHLAFTGTGLNPGSRAYNRSDGTIGASSGEVRFVGRSPQQFSCGVASSIPNLRIWNPQGVSKSHSSNPMIVTRSLDLSDGTFGFDPGTVIIENGATVIRRKTAATVGNALSFRTSVSVEYILDADNGILHTGSELPGDPSALSLLRVSNPHRLADSSLIILSGDVTVKDRIVLESGRLDVGNRLLKLAAGGTIDVGGGRIQSAPGSQGRFAVTSYHLIYSKSGVVNPVSLEFQSGSGMTVASFTVCGSDPASPTIVRLYANRTVEKFLMNAPGGGIEFGAPGSFVARNLTIRDSMMVLGGNFTNTSGTNAVISLAGTQRQFVSLPDTGLTLPGGASAIHLQLNNPTGFRLQGGDLRLSSGAIIFFVNGVLDAGDRTLVLSRTANSQGFDRQGIGTTGISHVRGRVSQSITGGAGSPDVYPNGRYEFPTGTATRYRPLILTFTSSDPARNPGSVEVNHVDALPAGTTGLPLDGGGGVRIGSAAPYHWSLRTTPGTLSGDQKFDFEAAVEAPGFRYSSVGELRFIMRREGPGEVFPWSLLGPGVGYGSSSSSINHRGDTVLSIRVQAAGQFSEGGALLTLGLPLDRRPYLNFRLPASISQIPLGIPTTFKVSVRDPDNKALTFIWKVNGATVISGPDTSFTHVFQTVATTQSVRAVFRNSDGFADSTEWNFTVVGIHDEDSGVPVGFALHQNFPNPFNPATSISYQVAASSIVTLKVYDLLGKEVALLTHGLRAPGSYTVQWDAAGLPSGTYLCRFTATELGGADSRFHAGMIRMLLTK